MTTKSPLILFSDLDGTLLDRQSYSFEQAQDALRALQKRSIPLILCSSKTKAEIEYYRRCMNNTHPFIVENGGAIFIPRRYFPEHAYSGIIPITSDSFYRIITLGTPYDALRAALNRLKESGFSTIGFGDMSIGEIAKLTRLPHELAVLAAQRMFDEPFVLRKDSLEIRTALYKTVVGLGLNLAEGDFLHLTGNNDKGKAVKVLLTLYERLHGKPVRSAAIGDGPNDIPMLESVHAGFLVMRTEQSHDNAIQSPNILRVPAAGPKGWALAVEYILTK